MSAREHLEKLWSIIKQKEGNPGIPVLAWIHV